MTEKPAPHFGSLARVMLVGELAGRHVVDEQLPAGPQGGDRRVEPFPLPALGIGEDQVEAVGPAGDFQGVTGGGRRYRAASAAVARHREPRSFRPFGGQPDWLWQYSRHPLLLRTSGCLCRMCTTGSVW